MKPIKIIQKLNEFEEIDDTTKKKASKDFKDLSSDIHDDPYSIMCGEPELMFKEGIKKIADKYFNGDVDRAYYFYYYELDESDSWNGDTTEYYGGTYPDPPEDDDDEPTEEEKWNAEMDAADNYNDEVKLGLRENNKYNVKLNFTLDEFRKAFENKYGKGSYYYNNDYKNSKLSIEDLYDTFTYDVYHNLYDNSIEGIMQSIEDDIKDMGSGSIIKHSNSKLKESSILEPKPVYMNTWKNYNEYGADLSAYGINSISDGWMTIDDALEFCKKYAEDEPFINDTDGVPIEISDYDNPVEKLEQLKKIEDADVDSDVLTAFIEEGSYKDIDEIIEKIESGDYIFFPGVDNDSDLGQAYVEMCGGPSAAVSKDRIRNFIDANAIKDNFEGAGEEIDDDELDDYIDSMLDSGSDDFIENYFDYDAFGSELSYDYTYTSTGALCSF